MEGWGKIKESAAYAGIGPRTMRDWVKKGLEHSRMSSVSLSRLMA
jgi:hypothetical protein